MFSNPVVISPQIKLNAYLDSHVFKHSALMQNHYQTIIRMLNVNNICLLVRLIKLERDAFKYYRIVQSIRLQNNAELQSRDNIATGIQFTINA